MKTFTRTLLFVLAAMGMAALVIAVSRRRERPRLMRDTDPRPSDFVEVVPQAGNGHGNGHHQEAAEEI